MKNLLIGIAVITALILVGVFLLVLNINPTIKNAIESAGPEILGVPVAVDSVDISFFNGTGTISGLRIANPGGYKGPNAIVIGEMSVQLDPKSLASDRIHIYEVIINDSTIAYEGNLSSSNLAELQNHADSFDDAMGSSNSSSEQPDESSQFVTIDRLQINNATITAALTFTDESLTMQLPVLELTDLGKNEDTTVGEVAGQIFSALNKSLIPLIQANTDLGTRIKEVGEKLGKKFGDLFKR